MTALESVLRALRLVDDGKTNTEHGNVIVSRAVPGLLAEDLIHYAPERAIGYALTPRGRAMLAGGAEPVRLDSLRVGDRFASAAGERWEVVGWLKDRAGPGGCPKVRNLTTGAESLFAGCAEGAPLIGETEEVRS